MSLFHSKNKILWLSWLSTKCINVIFQSFQIDNDCPFPRTNYFHLGLIHPLSRIFMKINLSRQIDAPLVVIKKWILKNKSAITNHLLKFVSCQTKPHSAFNCLEFIIPTLHYWSRDGDSTVVSCSEGLSAATHAVFVYCQPI